MREPRYHPHVAMACTRLYRPFRVASRHHSYIDRFTSRLWTRLDVAVYRHFGVSLVVKALGIEDAVMLRTRGRRTGLVREVIVAYIQCDGATVVCGANAGWDKTPGWYINIRNGSPIEIEHRGRRTEVVSTLLADDDRALALEQLCLAFPQLCTYGTRTTRPFPVVRLDSRDTDSTDPHEYSRIPGGEPAKVPSEPVEAVVVEALTRTA